MSDYIIEAYASIFSTVDLVGDKVLPGAFANSIMFWRASGKKVPCIYSHSWTDPAMQIGWVNPDDLVEDSKGLRFKAHLDVETNETAALVWQNMSRRVATEFSFAFDTLAERPGKDGSNVLIELDLIELGPCVKGAHPSTGDAPWSAYRASLKSRGAAAPKVVTALAKDVHKSGSLTCRNCGAFVQMSNPAHACVKCGAVIMPTYSDLTPLDEQAIRAVERKIEMVVLERFAQDVTN